MTLVSADLHTGRGGFHAAAAAQDGEDGPRYAERPVLIADEGGAAELLCQVSQGVACRHVDAPDRLARAALLGRHLRLKAGRVHLRRV